MLNEQNFLQQWQSHAFGAENNLQLALRGGSLATNVAQIFVAGYQACIRQIFNELTNAGWLSFAVSEAKEDSLRPGVVWHAQDDDLQLQGWKTWIAASRHVESLVVKAGRGSGAVYVLVPSRQVILRHKENPSMLPDLSQGEAQLDNVSLPLSQKLDAQHVKLFGQYEAVFVLFAVVGFVQAQGGDNSTAIELMVNECTSIWENQISQYKSLDQLEVLQQGVMALWQPYADLDGSALIKRYAKAS